MAIINEYKCEECGFEIDTEGRYFFYDPKLKITRDYLWLFSTVDLDKNSKITGFVNETYCWKCKKYVNVYIISQVEDNIENVCEIVKEGIKNDIDKKLLDINQLKEIKKREKYTIEKIEYEIAPNEYDSYYEITFPELYDGYKRRISGKLNENEAIKTALENFHSQIDFQIKQDTNEYKKRIKTTHLVLDYSDKSKNGDDNLDKVICPECNAKINKYVNEETPCPNCGGEISLINYICMD